MQSDIHGSNKRGVDSPAWRHIKMLASLVSDDGNTPLIKGFTDGIEPLSTEETDAAEEGGREDRHESRRREHRRRALHLRRSVHDAEDAALRHLVQLDGIWGGNMYAGGAGAILPNKITSKHNMRYVPKMNGLEMVKRIREQLDRNGYKDVEMKVIGDVPWSKMSYDTDIARAMNDDLRRSSTSRTASRRTTRRFSAATGRRICSRTRKSASRSRRSRCRSAWAAPATAATRTRPTSTTSSRAPGKVYGMAGAEKVAATIIYNFAALPQVEARNQARK